MVRAGWSPSVRLFEAAACGTPIVSDRWPGLEAFLRPGQEVLVADTAEQALRIVREMPDVQRRLVGARARQRVLAEHTAAHRAATLEEYVLTARGGRPFGLAAPHRAEEGESRLAATR